MTEHKKRTTLSPPETMRLALAARTDPKTILRVLSGAGGPKVQARERARKVLIEAGYLRADGSGS